MMVGAGTGLSPAEYNHHHEVIVSANLNPCVRRKSPGPNPGLFYSGKRPPAEGMNRRKVVSVFYIGNYKQISKIAGKARVAPLQTTLHPDARRCGWLLEKIQKGNLKAEV